jgi:hypothetical protein
MPTSRRNGGMRRRRKAPPSIEQLNFYAQGLFNALLTARTCAPIRLNRL